MRGAGLLFVVSDIQKLIYLSRGWGPMFSSVYFLLVYSDVMLSNPCDVKCKTVLFVEMLGADASCLSSSMLYVQCCFLVATSLI